MTLDADTSAVQQEIRDESSTSSNDHADPRQPVGPVVPAASAGWAGLLGAAAALAVGELLDRASDQVTSLVVAVGEGVIDATPGSVVARSINLLGSLQKPLLLTGIVVVALLIGWVAGIRLRRRSVAAMFVGFGIVGAVASARLPGTNVAASIAVAALAAVVGIVIYLTLHHLSKRPVNAAGVIIPGTALSQATDRRRLLAFGGAAAGTIAVVGASRVGRTGAGERARDALIETASAQPATSAPATTVAPTAAGFDLEGLTPRITPISPQDDFYLIDTALVKPQVDPNTWTLTIDGMVDREVIYTYDDLVSRDLVEAEVTLSCVSNPVGGDLVGNAVWRGIPLTTLLDEAGVDPTTPGTQIFSRSVDGWTCGFPTELAYDGRTTMLALEMNGEPLPVDHGFPARLVVAGLYGYVSATKWIERISITDWESVDGFWMPRGWSKEGPIKTQSRIDVPRSGAQVAPGSIAFGGIAWSPTIGIDTVEVAVLASDNSDAEPEWMPATLGDPTSDETWVQWRLDWDATPGSWIALVRATDKSGFTQSPIPVAPAPDGAEGYHAVNITVA